MLDNEEAVAKKNPIALYDSLLINYHHYLVHSTLALSLEASYSSF